MYVLYNCLVFHVKPEDGHDQASKHVVVSYIENTLYSTNKYSCVRPVRTPYISYTTVIKIIIIILLTIMQNYIPVPVKKEAWNSAC